ncbi:hypothetical protein [Natrarchaeobaculum sulfurireducens]|uniref:Uncharacterized protein n=1 Tax=Natrarchaeobaculum sulfurireducens TaxID=2044521 RepID=A0A346PMF8_9EURY|nr:hypothetical protein [Natrarchaeobaculum sulfurireducens]AXR80703.1 hypothetical protein AArcMg_0681 [Natrarchaeobaculum sulfurireducens]
MSAQNPDYDALADRALQTVAQNTLASYAIGLLVTLIVLLIAALVGGEFADAVPEDGAFGEAIETVIEHAGTAFVIFGVSILVLPAVAVIVLIVSGFGGMMGSGPGGR